MATFFPFPFFILLFICCKEIKFVLCNNSMEQLSLRFILCKCKVLLGARAER